MDVYTTWGEFYFIVSLPEGKPMFLAKVALTMGVLTIVLMTGSGYRATTFSLAGGAGTW